MKIILHRYVVMIVDEMKILFMTSMDEIYMNLLILGLSMSNYRSWQLQVSQPNESIATHMLTVMIWGIFIKLEFPYANFPTQG